MVEEGWEVGTDHLLSRDCLGLMGWFGLGGDRISEFSEFRNLGNFGVEGIPSGGVCPWCRDGSFGMLRVKR